MNSDYVQTIAFIFQSGRAELKKHATLYDSTEIFVMFLVLLVLICWLVLYFSALLLLCPRETLLAQQLEFNRTKLSNDLAPKA